MRNKCKCGSGKLFPHCCGRFLLGLEHPKTPQQLMRSRYSAYALGGYGGYLLRTWSPASATGLDAETLSQTSCDWLKLEILAHHQQGDQGSVEFNAWFRGENGEHQVLHEKSRFQRTGGVWLYVGGEVDQVPGTK